MLSAVYWNQRILMAEKQNAVRNCAVNHIRNQIKCCNERLVRNAYGLHMSNRLLNLFILQNPKYIPVL